MRNPLRTSSASVLGLAVASNTDDHARRKPGCLRREYLEQDEKRDPALAVRAKSAVF